MRADFFESLLKLAKENDSIYLLVGDLGYSFVEPFQQQFPNQFLNVGVAEQNMIGIAAGLALSGKIAFCYSIANFPTARCYEQIRNDVCYHNSDVKIVSSGGGVGYGNLGVTHHTTEDIAIMRALPNMTIVAPGDNIESGLATRAIALRRGPCYLRLAKASAMRVHHSAPDFEIGKAITIKHGEDVALISTGGMLTNAVSASALLEEHGISCEVLSMHTLKPIDDKTILSLAGRVKLIVSLEEHGPIGGLGSAVSEVVSQEGGNKTPILRLSIDDPFANIVGSQEFLQQYHGLSVESIVKKVTERLKP